MTTTTETKQDCFVFPYAASSEDKAEQFALAVEVLGIQYFPVQTEIFEDGGKWHVAITEGMENFKDDPVNVARIEAAFILLIDLDLVEGKSGTMDNLAEMLKDIPPAQKTSTRRARRAFRVEDKLDAILTVLVGTEGAKALEHPIGESRRLEPATV